MRPTARGVGFGRAALCSYPTAVASFECEMNGAIRCGYLGAVEFLRRTLVFLFWARWGGSSYPARLL